MEPIPVRKLRLPAYPTRLEVLDNPEILSRHLPPGWIRATEMAGAVGFFLAVNSSVLGADKPSPMTDDRTAIAAPIFKHGEGRGATGCVVVAPPVFLSEEEALQVITEELGKAGVKLEKKQVVLKNVVIPKREEQYRVVGEKVERKFIEKPGKPLTLDGMDAGKAVGVKFVSEAHYSDLVGSESLSTVEKYDFKEAAEQVVKSVKGKKKGIYLGSFYDPASPANWAEAWNGIRMKPEESDKEFLARMDKAVKDVQAKAATKSKELLRLQVKDFAEWLKGQGVI